VIDQVAFVETLSAFARRLVSDYRISDALHDLVIGSRQVLEITGVGVSLATEQRIEYVTADPGQIAPLERVQQDTQAGPCIDAYRSGQPVLVPDLGAEGQRWPAIAAAAAQAGLIAVAGIPMLLDGVILGVVNLYHNERHDWGDDEVRIAQLLAAMATGYVVNAQRFDRVRHTAEQLQEALDSRVVIEQAKGMLAADAGISIDEAFNRLRIHARKHQAALRSVAEAVVNLRLRL
jgi:GAF domain-containing protein